MAVVIVRSTAHLGHFRVGRHFPREPQMVELSDAELALVRADPRLVIVEDDSTPTAASISSLPPPVADSSSAGGDSSKRPKR